MYRLAIVASHPIQYYAPLFREFARQIDIEVLYAHRATPRQQACAGFGTEFEWDVDLLSGYAHRFLYNVSKKPNTFTFAGCDTPEIGNIIRRGQYDAVLVTGWHLKSYIQGIIAAKREGLPVLVRGDSHLETPRHYSRKVIKSIIYPSFLRVFDAVLYVGTRNREYYQHYNVPKHKLFYSPHCIDTQWFSKEASGEAGECLRRELGILDDEDVILFAGKLLPFKRPLDVVRATAIIARDRNVSLMIAGSGQLEVEIRNLASALNVKLHYLGFCNQSKMPSVYAASQVLVLPSTGRETWGLVCNESLACGTPIIVSENVGCAPDLACDGHIGRIFREGNIDSLADAINLTLQNKSKPDLFRILSNQFDVRVATNGLLSALDFVLS